MQSSQNVSLLQLLGGLGPILCPRLSPDPSTMERTVTEGLMLPDIGSMAENAIDPQLATRPMRDAAEWIKTILRPEYLTRNWEKKLVPLPHATNGQDAIIGAWTCGGRSLQVIV